MGHTIRSTWTSTLDAGIPKRDRSPCRYEAYVPDALARREFALDGAVAAAVSEAEGAIIRLNEEATTLVDTEALARLLLRAESVASSKIEGLEIGGRRLLRAEAARNLGDEPRDVTAVEVIGNIDAMAWAMQHTGPGEDVTVSGLLDVHRRLLSNTRLAAHGGVIRDVQNWIGGSSFNPCSAAFVPPPPDLVPELLADLCDFCNDDALPAIAQAAVAHAQFETIHPFVDGNGRAGRALIQMVLRRRGLTPRVFPPVSLILATYAQDYVLRLSGTRSVGPPDAAAAHDGMNAWIALFAQSCIRSVADAGSFEERVRSLQARWRERVGRVRANSALDLLIRALPGAPVVTVNAAAEMIGRSFQATNTAIAQLAGAGVLAPITVGRRNRAFEAADIIDAFADFERQMASPQADTQIAPPVRSVPRRRPQRA